MNPPSQPFVGAQSLGRPPLVRRRRARERTTDLLTAFGFVPPSSHGPLGFGVTAHSLDDALAVIRRAGFGDYLPEDVGSLRIAEGVGVAELEHPHVREHMGPIVVRGLWYPFVRVGNGT